MASTFAMCARRFAWDIIPGLMSRQSGRRSGRMRLIFPGHVLLTDADEYPPKESTRVGLEILFNVNVPNKTR